MHKLSDWLRYFKKSKKVFAASVTSADCRPYMCCVVVDYCYCYFIFLIKNRTNYFCGARRCMQLEMASIYK